MGMATKVRMLLIARNMTIKDLAEKIGTSGQNLNAKLRRDNLAEKDLIQIADVCNADLECNFILRDTGKEI